jgi:ribosome biogenesis GTPase
MPRKRPPHRQQQKQKQELSNTGLDGQEVNQGLVVARFGAKLDVEDDSGTVFRCTSRRKFGAVVCGDRVTWQPTHDNEGVIVERLPRTTLLARPDDAGRDKPIAANISRIIIVATVKALNDERYHLNHNLIDRYIVAAEHLSITPVIVINKIDLLTQDERQQLEQDMQPYREIGYRVIHTSTKLEHGLEQLTRELADHTSVFVGESGVGKSSIIGALLADAGIRVGAVSASSGKGKHTTTATTIYHLADGGDLIDSPGVREFGLSSIEAAELAFNFIEFRSYIGQCKFHNCIHKSEPRCAIKQAVDDGAVNARRYGNYLEILDSL